jgi:N-acetylglutamate synthase-like GNAT family acetyltransferase
MLPVFVRAARKEDREKFAEWAAKTPKNELDLDVVGYKSTSFRCAYNRDKIICFLPVQRALHMESLARNPDASDTEVAAALLALLQDTMRSAEEEGVGEIYFMGTEETVPKLAARRGFEELPYRIFRLKLKNSEPLDVY